jgi:septal ring factor EnvC (AmiA/AmiB activator)
MTLLGKVFIGLILLLSIVFFSFAVAVNASHVNTKELAAQYEQQARESETRNTQLEALRDSYKAEIDIEQASKRAALAALQTQYEAAEYRLLQLEIEAGQLRQALTVAVQTNDATQKDLRDAAERNRQLREEIDQAKTRRDDLFRQLLDAHGEYVRLQGAHQALSDRSSSLETGN